MKFRQNRLYTKFHQPENPLDDKDRGRYTENNKIYGYICIENEFKNQVIIRLCSFYKAMTVNCS